MVKSVIQNIPTYSMATFKLPISFCRSLDKMTRKFWWSGKCAQGNFLALRRWDRLCQPKNCGGLGFRKFEDTNLALLAKLGWKVATDPNAMWVNLLRQKYCRIDSFFSVEPKKSDSSGWKDVLGTRNFIKESAVFLVGNGKGVKVFDDFWCFDDRLVRQKAGTMGGPALVSELLLPSVCWWNEVLVRQWCDEENAEVILRTRIMLGNRTNKLIWKPNELRNFSVKSAARWLSHGGFDPKDKFCGIVCGRYRFMRGVSFFCGV